ncbi:hypothetical protein V1511DRAFT_339075 [Dipodascopsis uninucleata]
MLVTRIGLFLLSLSFCVVSICAARQSFFFGENGESARSRGAKAAAAAGLSSSSASTSESSDSSAISFSEFSLSSFSTSVMALVYSALLLTSGREKYISTNIKQGSAESCCTSRWQFPKSFFCDCSNVDDDNDVSVNKAFSAEVLETNNGCSSGDDFMSCRMVTKRGKKYNDVTTPGQEFWKALAEGEYASKFCTADISDTRDFNMKICSQLGLATTKESTPHSSPGIQIYKPPLRSLPLQPTSTHILSSLLGSSSKTTLFLKAFAKSIYKFNNISVMSSSAIVRSQIAPTPISTYIVMQPTLEPEIKSGNEIENTNQILENSGKMHFIETTVTEAPKIVNTEKNFEVLYSQNIPLDANFKGKEENGSQNVAPLHRTLSNKSSGIATRLNVREVLSSNNFRGPSSVLGLVVAMLCLVCMGM